MNERIKQFAEQAGYKHSDAVGMCEDYAYFNHEKFAQLIVRECAGIVTDAVDHREPASTYADRIQQHFGVE